MEMTGGYSLEERNLFNPAYVGTILYQSIRECQRHNEQGLHCALPYLVAPLAISPQYSKRLPSNITTPIAGWVSHQEGALIGFSSAIKAYVDIVDAAMIFLIDHGAVALRDNGYYFLPNDRMAKLPALVNRDKTFKESFLSAGFLGRWFGHAASVESIYAQFGVKP
ncbi:three component ABC system middle component [Amphritea pacifica]|uniref:Uncharacterized protein n=1 Tax=Amphritea pacifica TaxID=2811233 RepID=A0ABS2WCB7_9GAMM|nr:three component ABC system middle component [Amphritea pacifica]MBN0989360.1 hypothetical protein [Amphritea pacifica]